MTLTHARLRNAVRQVKRVATDVSFGLRSPLQWLRRRNELATLDPRRIDLEVEFSRFLGIPLQLVADLPKRSSDEIYYATREGRKIAVVRVNSPCKKHVPSARPQDVAVPLPSRERLHREWAAYRQLFPAGLSPQPIWRTDDAIACGWLDWPRASETVMRDRKQFWPLMEAILPAIRRMHDCGVTHLDLNLGNILAEPATRKIAFIDFEFGPVAAVTVTQQRAYDYLRLIDECARPRRGGKKMLGDIERLIALLAGCVDAESRDAELTFARQKLQRLTSQSTLCEKLRAVFPRI